MSGQLKEIVNSPILWIITVIMLGILVSLATIYLVKTIRVSKKMGITNEQLKIAVTTSCFASIGPSVVVMVGMVSLLIIVGAPTALMRLSVVGNVGFETMCAGLAADMFGTTASAQNMTPEIFQTTVFIMAVGCIGYMIIPPLFCNSFEKILEKINGNGKNIKRATALSVAAILGCYAYVQAPFIVSFDRSTVAVVIGFVVMFILQKIQKKTQIKWLLEWGLLIAMFSGMIVAAIV